MKTKLLILESAAALVWFAAPAWAQSMNSATMTMPMREKTVLKARTGAINAARKTSSAKKAHAKKAGSKVTTSGHPRRRAHHGIAMHMNGGSSALPAHIKARSSSQIVMQIDHRLQQGTATMPSESRSSTAEPMNRWMPSQSTHAGQMTMPMDHERMGKIGEIPMQGMEHGSQDMTMKAARGPYPEERESSGTAWQPDASAVMTGPMIMLGNWTLMAHGTLNLVYDHQSGPRGGDKAFVSGLVMGTAQHALGRGTIQFRAMLSPDPLMGSNGYPLLLASGETANGRDRLIDRQHPHDFFMELSGSVSQNIGSKSSVFLYAGLPGEPAFGPPAFMHREAILDSPEAPITHHWLDSTHISFGVLTLGLVLDRFKIETSRFNGREPDQHRWDIESGPLDSTSVRLSWNPARSLALQGSWAHLVDPEQLEPGVSQTRWSASALWAKDIAPGWHAAATLAWGRKSSLGKNDDGYVAETSLKHDAWTVFARGELVENRELIFDADQSAYRVGKVSVGALRYFRLADHLSLGAGALVSVDFVPTALSPHYGKPNPTGAMGFVRLKLD